MLGIYGLLHVCIIIALDLVDASVWIFALQFLLAPEVHHLGAV